VSIASRGLNVVRAGVRSGIRRVLSQERRSELKRLQGAARKRLSPMLTVVHGSFGTKELVAELKKRLPDDFEILMVHSSFDQFQPMFKGTAKELVSCLIELCGPQRTLVMPSFVMGGRNYDAAEYYRSKPFDVRTTPSEMGLIAEIFRRTPGVIRSVHPTASICALGPLAKELTTGHHLARNGLSPDSPFGLMSRRPTAILGLGVEDFRGLTHVHAATHQMGNDYPIKFVENFVMMTVVDYDGSRHEHKLGLPDRTKKLDLRILWSLMSKEELQEWRLHGVPMFVISRAGLVTERLIEAARRGITIFGKVPVTGLSEATVKGN
jgi:aminoglycoside 3-N-acetyltransferase